MVVAASQTQRDCGQLRIGESTRTSDGGSGLAETRIKMLVCGRARFGAVRYDPEEGAIAFRVGATRQDQNPARGRGLTSGRGQGQVYAVKSWSTRMKCGRMRRESRDFDQGQSGASS